MIPNNMDTLTLAAHTNKTAADLKIGQTGTIMRLGDEELSLKLLEMGCLPGETILMQHIAPLGGPVCIRVSGYNLSLRKSEAEAIYMMQEAGSEPASNLPASRLFVNHLQPHSLRR